jgi:glycosyltransferase involved in cell wall biosynthesis
MPLVSVVIPCHNSARYLEQTLASVHAQTHGAVETILVNDGTDDLRDLSTLQKLSGAVDRYIELPHSGLPAARNAGVRIARGDYFVPLDADDLLSPTYIAECFEALERRPQASFLHTD